MSSPVKDAGPGKKSAIPESIVSSWALANEVRVAYLGLKRRPVIVWAIFDARGPESRTMPTPPLPGGVAMAAMVSGCAAAERLRLAAFFNFVRYIPLLCNG